MNSFFRISVLGLSLAALHPSSLLAASAVSPKVSGDAMEAAGQQSVPVVIQYRTTPSLADLNKITSAGGRVLKMFAYVPAVAATIPGSAIAQLASDPDVTYLSVDRQLSSRQTAYAAEPIHAPALWASHLDGTGLGIAVIDSGINANQSDLSGGKKSVRVAFAYSFVANGTTNGSSDNNGNKNDKSDKSKDGEGNGTVDAFGHGTHVAGIIAGNGQLSTGKSYYRSFSGVAPNATLIDLQVLDANGQGSDSAVIAAIDMAIALRNVYNIRIINLSLGRPVFESYTLDPLCQAVEQAWKAGIVVVVAAGNDGHLTAFNPEGYGTINAPGNDPYVITVGAANTNGTPAAQDDTVASYSSKGPSLIDHIAKPDLIAPGSQIVSLRTANSTLVTQNPSLITPLSSYVTKGSSAASADYFPLSGTSMAAAVTSGATALLLQAQPQLTPDQVKALLMRDASKTDFPQSSAVTDAVTGSTYVAYNDMLTTGAGYLDIQASVLDARANAGSLPAGYALSPSTFLDPTTSKLSLLFDPQSLWTSSVAWAPESLYGSQAFDPTVNSSTIIWGRSSIYGSTIIWGRSSLAGSTIIWGRTGVDGSTIIWGRTLPGELTQ